MVVAARDWHVPCQNLLTYLLTYSRQQSPSWEANSSQLVKKFPAFYRTRRFITAFTSVRQPSLSWASSIQSIPPHPTFWRTLLILSSHLCLGLPSGLFPSGFPTETLYMPPLSPIRATCSAHPILDFITRTTLGEQYRSLSSSLCSFQHFPVTSPLLGPDILLNTIFSKILTQQKTYCSHFALETFTLQTEQFSYMISPEDWTM